MRARGLRLAPAPLRPKPEMRDEDDRACAEADGVTRDATARQPGGTGAGVVAEDEQIRLGAGAQQRVEGRAVGGHQLGADSQIGAPYGYDLAWASTAPPVGPAQAARA